MVPKLMWFLQKECVLGALKTAEMAKACGIKPPTVYNYRKLLLLAEVNASDEITFDLPALSIAEMSRDTEEQGQDRNGGESISIVDHENDLVQTLALQIGDQWKDKSPFGKEEDDDPSILILDGDLISHDPASMDVFPQAFVS